MNDLSADALSQWIQQLEETIRKSTQIQVEIEAMKMANYERELRGEAPAYGEKQFLEVINNYKLKNRGNNHGRQ